MLNVRVHSNERITLQRWKISRFYTVQQVQLLTFRYFNTIKQVQFFLLRLNLAKFNRNSEGPLEWNIVISIVTVNFSCLLGILMIFHHFDVFFNAWYHQIFIVNYHSVSLIVRELFFISHDKIIHLMILLLILIEDIRVL